MDEEYQIAYLEEPAWGIIGGGISDYNTEKAGDDHGQNLCFVLRNLEDEIVGGVIGAIHWNWFYVNLMWIREDLRDQGYGNQLLALAEEKAREQGAKKSYLDTFSFQAPDFYKKNGYKVFGELKEFPPGHQRYYLEKDL
jgi:GNAT superfamily N-acetyltransferase